MFLSRTIWKNPWRWDHYLSYPKENKCANLVIHSWSPLFKVHKNLTEWWNTQCHLAVGSKSKASLWSKCHPTNEKKTENPTGLSFRVFPSSQLAPMISWRFRGRFLSSSPSAHVVLHENRSEKPEVGMKSRIWGWHTPAKRTEAWLNTSILVSWTWGPGPVCLN